MSKGRKPEQLNKDSWTSWLLTFELNERRYVETTLEKYAKDMRVMNGPKSRRPKAWQMNYKTSLFTALSASSLTDIRYLICVERIA